MVYLDNLRDNRVECFSVLAKIDALEYLKIINNAYKNRGGIQGQRSPLKTKSAQRIRKRLVEDIEKNSVIPPIVIGVRVSNEKFENLNINDSESLNSFWNDLDNENLSIIDGMQRTTALIEAKDKGTIDKNYQIRLELWISHSSNSLVYRMLVLNSGQIPWNLKRQLNVVFSQFISELKDNIPGLDLIDTDEESRRKKAGMYQASHFVELFMLFGSRRVSIDLQAELAEEFTRLDIAETSGNQNFMKYFIGVSSLLVELDKVFSNLTNPVTEIELKKYKTGLSIFSSQPARAAFVTACSQEIFGILGTQLNEDVQNSKYEKLATSISNYISTMPTSQKELSEILDLPTLDERTNLKTSKVGEFERNYFLSAFKTFISLVKDNELQNMTPCWVSYQ